MRFDAGRRRRGAKTASERCAEGPRVLFVDLDDTLFDHRAASRSTLARLRSESPVLAALPLPALVDRYARHLDDLHPMVLDGSLSIEAARAERMRRLLRDAGSSATPTEVRRWSARARRHYRAARRPTPGAVPFLRYAHRRARTVIISNNRTDEQEEKLRVLGLAPHVDLLLTSEELGAVKPDPRFFRDALRRADAARSEVVVLGDSWRADVVGARRSGLPVVWYGRAGVRAPMGAPPVPRLRSLVPPTSAWGTLVHAWSGARSGPDRRGTLPGGSGR